MLLSGHFLYVSIKVEKKSKEPWFLISNMQFINPINLYKKRWEIETLFGCLKTKGFRLEDTHMIEPHKIEKLIFILTIAFCWSYKIGELESTRTPIKTKTHGRKEKSIFRLGYNLIRSVFYKIYRKFDDFLRLLGCLIGEDYVISK